MVSNSLLLANLFFTSSLIGAALLYCVSKPSRREFAAMFAIGLLLLWKFGLAGAAYERVMLGGAYFGAAALLTNCLYLLFIDQSLRRMKLLVEMASGPLSIVVLVLALGVSGKINPVYDRYLYTFDGSFGFQPGFLAARVLLAHNWLRIPSAMAYVNLPLALGVAYAMIRNKSAELATEMFRTVMGVGVFGYLAYLIFPVVGSAAALPGVFPFQEPAFGHNWVVPIALGVGPRNCMPSLHASWALVLWRTAGHGSRPIRWALACYLFFLVLETLACHYLADLIAAVPFTLAIQAASAGLRQTAVPPQWKPLLIGTAVFAGWLLLIRFGWTICLWTPVIPWSLGVATIWICRWAEHHTPFASERLLATSEVPA